MKLYECPRNVRIRVAERADIPVNTIPITFDEELFFYYLDGMYSYCKNSKGQVVHLAAYTEVEIVE